MSNNTDETTFSLVPSSFDDAIKISKLLAASDLVPKDFKGKPENCVVAIAWGQEIGLGALQALQGIAVINGRPALWGDAALAVVRAHPDFEDIEETIAGDGDKKTATCTIKRKGQAPTTVTFSIADAKTAGLYKKQGPWTNYENRMLQMRARGFALRDSFTDALKGFKTAEEEQDIEKEINPEAGRAAIVMPSAAQPVTEQPVDAVFEELKDLDGGTDTSQPEVVQPAKASTAEKTQEAGEAVVTLSNSQVRIIRTKLAQANLDEKALTDYFTKETGRIEAIAASECNDVLAWIKKGGVV
jgi:hypothetical protein